MILSNTEFDLIFIEIAAELDEQKQLKSSFRIQQTYY